MKKLLLLSLTAGSLLMSPAMVSAHCQIPCGIYHDQIVVGGMREDVQTMEKAVTSLLSLKPDSPESQNQMVRWVMEKDQQADKLAKTITTYFLQQRIKLDAEDLDQKVVSAHKILVLSMKVKQTVDTKQVDALRGELESFIELMGLNEDHHGEGHSH